MKRKGFLIITMTAYLFSCGSGNPDEKPTQNSKNIDSSDIAAKDSIAIPENVVTPDSVQQKGNIKIIFKENTQENKEGIKIGSIEPNGEIVSPLSPETLKIKAFLNLPPGNYTPLKVWIEKASAEKYYLIGAAQGSKGEALTVAKLLSLELNNLYLNDDHQLIEWCSSKGCESCRMEWKPDGTFDKCGCPGDSRQMCSHRTIVK